MEFIEIILFLSIITLAVLVFVMMKMIGKMDAQFKKMKGLELDDSVLEEKLNEEIEAIKIEQQNMLQDFSSRIEDLKSEIDRLESLIKEDGIKEVGE